MDYANSYDWRGLDYHSYRQACELKNVTPLSANDAAKLVIDYCGKLDWELAAYLTK